VVRKSREVESWFVPAQEVTCPLCDRAIPADQADDHHLVPKLKGGKETKTLHRICHRQLHALFTESELANHFSTVEALLGHPEVQKFVGWVKSKPPGFYESSKRSNRRR
jgi:hypothetical protein